MMTKVEIPGVGKGLIKDAEIQSETVTKDHLIHTECCSIPTVYAGDLHTICLM